MSRFVPLVGLVVACLTTAAGAGPRPLAAQEPARVVRALDFVGNDAIDDQTLAIAIGTTNSSWFARVPPFRWLGLGEKRFFDEQEFRRDVYRILLLYRLSGYLGATVDTMVRRSEESVRVRFIIDEGRPVRITSFRVEGIDTLPEREEVLQDLPLREGDPFNRLLLQAASDSIARRLRDRGFPYALVLRNFTVDQDSRTATVRLEVDPGTRAVFGPVRVEGADRLDSAFVRRMVSVRPGQTYSEERLFESQRNLYNSELFRFASVEIDSANLEQGEARVPLLVRVTEGKFRRIRGAWGYGTDDCFRTGLGWTARNFLGGGRVLDLTGRLSKIGVGDPVGFGAERNICAPIQDDTIGSSRANYNAVASVRKPNFLSPQNTATYSIFTERRSEFKAYRRTEHGTSFGITQETARRIPLSLTYRLSYGRTEADQANFCAFFNVCTAGDIAFLRRRQFLGTLTFTATWLQANNPLNPTRGQVASVEVTHSSRLIGSSSTQQFNRVVADAAWYRQLGRDVVLSYHVRGGIVFSPRLTLTGDLATFVPPEHRFYGGGPTDVRGYERNELGPVVYVFTPDSAAPDSFLVEGRYERGRVRFSPTGGNTQVTGNVELRVPAPIFRERLRLALFVDAGSVWQRGEGSGSPFQLRFTPGAGLRFTTPLGPVRFDVAYNGYRRPPGALYRVEPNGDLRLVDADFELPRRRSYTIHFAVGQPF
ncbi:MAG TPA: BamA/TamA family outer membrane protein [Gemmatimonadales bacterium]|nr:BamA/TamA family outer membrane protein [Gemmatimonadales bacterium]